MRFQLCTVYRSWGFRGGIYSHSPILRTKCSQKHMGRREVGWVNCSFGKKIPSISNCQHKRLTETPSNSTKFGKFINPILLLYPRNYMLQLRSQENAKRVLHTEDWNANNIKELIFYFCNSFFHALMLQLEQIIFHI